MLCSRVSVGAGCVGWSVLMGVGTWVCVRVVVVEMFGNA